jgi:hypothetical protein
MWSHNGIIYSIKRNKLHIDVSKITAELGGKKTCIIINTLYFLFETGSCYIAHAGLDPPASVSQVLELQACLTMPNYLTYF